MHSEADAKLGGLIMDMYYVTGLISALCVVATPWLVVIIPLVGIFLAIKFFKYLWVFMSSIFKRG
jgi:hypothetical protein